ncbi:MAG: hypothetical protein REI11_04580 [Patulibacter sp.]|nr:hypothetical protein [Patulibacter sp.]
MSAITITRHPLPVSDEQAAGLFYVFTWRLLGEAETMIEVDKWPEADIDSVDEIAVERAVRNAESAALSLRVIAGARKRLLPPGIDLELVAAQAARQLASDMQALSDERDCLRRYLAGDSRYGFGMHGGDTDSEATYRGQIATWERNVAACRVALDFATDALTGVDGVSALAVAA